MSVDKEDIQNNINEALNNEAPDEVIDNEIVESNFNLDEALSGEMHPNLSKLLTDGLITEDQITESASNRGWTPDGKDKFGYKISEIEFLERKPLFDTIGGLKNKTEDLEKKFNKVIEHNKKIAAKSIEKQKNLEKQLEETKSNLLSQDYLDEEGLKSVKEIDTQLENVRETISDDSAPQDEEAWDDALLDFTAENPWYGTNEGLTDAAKVFAKKYNKNNKSSTPEDFYSGVKEMMMEKFGEQMMFPDKEDKKRRQPNVGSNNNRQPIRQPKKARTLDDIPEEERAIAREVIDSGISEEEYLSTYYRG